MRFALLPSPAADEDGYDTSPITVIVSAHNAPELDAALPTGGVWGPRSHVEPACDRVSALAELLGVVAAYLDVASLVQFEMSSRHCRAAVRTGPSWRQACSGDFDIPSWPARG